MGGQPHTEGSDRWWDPFGLWTRPERAPAQPIGSALLLPGAWWNLPQALFDALRSRLVGKAVSFGEGESALAFTLTSLEGSVGPAAGVSGQLDDVSLHAERVEWRRAQFERVVVRFANYHTRPVPRPVVVAAPVDVSAVMTSDALTGVLARVAPSWCCEVADHGRLRLRRSRRPGWGHLLVQPEVQGGVLVLRARAVGRGQRSWPLPAWLPPLRRDLNLPDGVRLTGLEVGEGEVVVHLRRDELAVDVLGLMSWAQRGA